MCNEIYSRDMIVPLEAEIFKEEIINEIVEIQCNQPEIDRIVDVIISHEIKDYKLVKTKIVKSNEGQNLTGFELLVNIVIKENINYISNNNNKNIFTIKNENIKTMFVIVPEQINDEKISMLLRRGRILITPYIECIVTRKLNSRMLQNCIMIFLNVNKV